MALVTSYLDDLSVSSSVERDLTLVLGMTSAFLASWDVHMNPSKSVVALNLPARRVWHWGFDGLKEACCWDFMGISLGYAKYSQRSAARIVRAETRVQRIRAWPGSLREKCRLLSILIPGLYYGLCFELTHRGPLMRLSSVIWEILWGRRRFCASRPLGWALVMPRQACPITTWWLSASDHVRRLASNEDGRALVLKVWDRGWSNYPGLWGVFSSVLRELGTSCVPGGRATWSHKILLDLDMPRAQWAHQSRWIVRAWWVVKSGRSVQQAFRLDLKSCDRMVGKVGSDGLDSARTLALHAYLTRALQHSHFGDVTPWCEHCQEYDSQYHRLWSCPRLTQVRKMRDLTLRMRLSFLKEVWILPRGEFRCFLVKRWGGGLLGSAEYVRWIDANLLSGLKKEVGSVWSVSVVVCETRGQHPLAKVVTMSVRCPDSENKFYVSYTGPAEGIAKDACACVGVMRTLVLARLAGAVFMGISSDTFRSWLFSSDAPWERLRITLRQAGDFCTFSERSRDPDAVSAVTKAHARREPGKLIRALDLRWGVAKKIQWMADYIGDFYPDSSRDAYQGRVKRVYGATAGELEPAGAAAWT